jgi:transposase
LERYPITARSLERHYRIEGDKFERQYKEHLSGFNEWDQLGHAEEWMVFERNVGERLSIDETSLSKGELYTIITNKDAHGGKGTLVAMVRGTKAETVINAVKHIGEDSREKVMEVTMDLSESMRKIVEVCFPKATRVIDRFHVQKLALEAVQEIRVKRRWEAIDADNKAKAVAKRNGEDYVPYTFDNGDTRKELLARSRYLLFKSPEKWTETQKERADALFREYPDIEQAYQLSQHLRAVFNKKSQKSAARLNLAKWYNEVDKADFASFQTLAGTIYSRYDEVLNYFNDRSTNANAEAFNSKLKNFRAALRGVSDISFFLFRLQKIYA